MKKVIFISALAIAAAVSCTKSDIVDTKFNEQIGFTTYLGRDAQTKAAVTTTDNLAQFGVYGFYTGVDEYDPTVNTTANLMDHQVVNKDTDGNWIYTPAKYWTNGTDNYTFFAYAPYSVGKVGGAPEITYTVDNVLANQHDVIYSVNNRDVTKNECTVTSGTGETATSTTYVPFTFKHALARLSVKAKAVMYHADGSEVTESNPLTEEKKADNTFTITDITISGKFCTTGTMDLSAPFVTEGETVTGGPVWDADPSTENVIYDLTSTTGQLLDAEYYDFSAEEEKNYLMMIPTNFSAEDATPAVLTVKYKVTYAGTTSDEIEKSVNINTNFEQGKAYTINLTLQRDPSNEIKFTVTTVESWGGEIEASEPTINA